MRAEVRCRDGQGEMFLGWCEREFKIGGLGRGELGFGK